MKFKTDDYVRVKADGRIGSADVYENENKIEVWFEDCDGPNNVESFSPEELELISPWTISAEDAMALVRLEKLPSDLIPAGAIRRNFQAEGYQLTLDDLLHGYEQFANVPRKEISDWSWMLLKIAGNFNKSACYAEVNEANAFGYALSELYRIPDDPEEEYQLPEGFLDDLKMLIDELKKPLDNRSMPLSWKHKIARFFDEDNIDKQSASVQKLFCEGLEDLCAANDPAALRKKGYCMYQGTQMYPQNWPVCRDIFLKHYELTGDAVTANTLGYIFYYGRATNGVPEYDRAFYFFSIGHAKGLYESSYKLADMFTHGYGVIQNSDIAFQLYQSVYADSCPRFCRGEHTKFADAALRMGNCYTNGIGTAVDPEAAYAYYLEADLALRLRAKKGYFGDSVVAANLRKALTQAKQDYTEERKALTEVPFWQLLNIALQQNQQLLIKWKQRKDGTWKITIRPANHHYVKPKLLVTLPECDYCNLIKKLVFTADESVSFTKGKGKKGIIFDAVSHEVKEHKRHIYRFYLGDQKCCEMHVNQLTLILPEPEKSANNQGEPVFMVSIRFNESGRCYDYLADDTTLQPGDLVIVNGYNGPTVVPVISCGMVQPAELALQLEQYKKIIGRADEKA